ncbi:MAG TPA: glycosyltransferase family 9 protein [Ohtaekwangia sp.]|uniref:glycosyltransferase family 9 protein n=1 Tax=Ohtaekwangia sp. TaxID=2066019 RepID=UPI002F93E0F5
MKAIIRAKPWRGDKPPRKILVMRFQALGDTVITLPYVQSIKRQYPQTVLHLFTREEVSRIPKSIILFDRIFSLGGKRNAKVQFVLALLMMPLLWMQRYDAVIDLQHHRFSKIIRWLLGAKAWSVFDTNSPISAGERTRQTIEALWTWKISLDTAFTFKSIEGIDTLLYKNGYKKGHDLVVFNPAGYCVSRNWPLPYYTEFAKLWIKQNPMTQFVLLLLPSLHEKATFIQKEIGDHCINLTGKADQLEAFKIIQRSKLVISEDSGLMHMAWVQGVATIALFSSSRKDWSAPQGEWSVCLDSSDLACGPCGLEQCTFGDNRCLTRYSPSYVSNIAQQLLSHSATV